MIERTHLTILRAIDQYGSLTAASENLFLTQSALSHTIKKLEGQIGSRLWEKDGRNIRLTQAGEYLLKEANRVLPQLERIDETLSRFANSEQGSLHIGMECHPCYQWLLKVVEPFLEHFPGVDLDVKQRFQFGGMAALFNHDIDILVTPDPIQKEGIIFEPVFPYEQVLIVSTHNPLSQNAFITPEQLRSETLFTYPVEIERLDIFQQFLLPAHCRPKKHKTLEATEIILQMVAANRGVATLPAWLGQEYAQTLPIGLVRLGQAGLHKQIYLGVREQEVEGLHIQTFFKLAKAF
ncbi:LysR family transcriptional regulator, regulator for metE and metH [Oceanospirillum multiglobuliferum]|uniref:HTH-type transcriptional regulator MetR n=1 Tax=Oceanospirillum multiglobuliferum TaxID=64969 RepID=A0A1T4QJX0_9GAMM|nr:LysR family transcriptional regulator [Oceanospirillum multiglobuliferum]OPX56409.1 LysR family transcriptional regulator [Oceanospirillum multiglobuliferum]SKA03984.1 LysR family transcriptional regulator, regulator for metE and metH [Oceanospirillum multiglobuliferum]